MAKMTENDCYREIERMARIAIEYEDDGSFVKYCRTTMKTALNTLDEVRNEKAERRKERAAKAYSKNMGIRKR